MRYRLRFMRIFDSFVFVIASTRVFAADANTILVGETIRTLSNVNVGNDKSQISENTFFRFPAAQIDSNMGSAISFANVEEDNLSVTDERHEDVRRAQIGGACAQEFNAAQSCVDTERLTECAYCVDLALSAFIYTPLLTFCQVFDAVNCGALHSGCTCSPCEEELDAWHKCTFDELSEGQCGASDCTANDIVITPTCHSQMETLVSCSHFVAPDCTRCLRDSYFNIFGGAQYVYCGDFEDGICSAISSTCSCSPCEVEAQDFYECVSFTSGDCLALICSEELPSPPSQSPVASPSNEGIVCPSERSRVDACVSTTTTTCLECVENASKASLESFNSVSCDAFTNQICTDINEGCECEPCSAPVVEYYDCLIDKLFDGACSTLGCIPSAIKIPPSIAGQTETISNSLPTQAPQINSGATPTASPNLMSAMSGAQRSNGGESSSVAVVVGSTLGGAAVVALLSGLFILVRNRANGKGGNKEPEKSANDFTNTGPETDQAIEEERVAAPIQHIYEPSMGTLSDISQSYIPSPPENDPPRFQDQPQSIAAVSLAKGSTQRQRDPLQTPIPRQRQPIDP